MPQQTVKPAGAQMRAVRNFLTAMLFLSPSLLIFIFFVFIPLFKTIDLSTFLTNQIGIPIERNFPENYQRVFSEPDLFNSIKVSFLFTLYVVPTLLIVSLGLALLANIPLRGITFFRVVFSSTVAISGATASLIFLLLYNPVNGPFNYFLDVLNLPRVEWLIKESSALYSVAAVSIWLNLGFNVIIFLAGLQGISQELYEAARIDGADFWAQFRHITVPMISPTIFFLAVVGTLNALQTFTQINILTKGGPVESTNVLVYLIYRAFYFNGQYGIAATLSVILFLLMLILTIIQFGVLERRVHYS